MKTNYNFLKMSALIIAGALFVSSLSVELVYAEEDNLATTEDADLAEGDSDENFKEIPKDAEEFNGNFYKIFEDRLSWTEAEQKCEDLGGHLATITTEEEQNFIESISDARLWIGGYRDDDFNWYWITGEDWEYTNWGDGEPNNSSNVIPNEKYASIWPKKWNDLAENSSEQRGYICEWDSNSESGDLDSSKDNDPVLQQLEELQSELIELKDENDMLKNALQEYGIEYD